MRSGTLAIACGVFALAADWPQFRGTNRDGVSTERGLSTEWPEGGPPELWRRQLGLGYSGISVVGERLYTLFEAGGEQLAVCLDAATGAEVWRRRVDGPYRNEYGGGPRSTPALDGGRVFALSANAQLWALKGDDGGVVWRRDLAEEYGARVPQWGVATSPLVEGDLVLVDVGGRNGSARVAFDKKTGEEVWRSGTDKAGYSAPIAITVGETRQAVFLSASKLSGVALRDGSRLWEVDWETSYDVNASTPIFIAPDKLFVSTGYDVGAALFKLVPSAGSFEVERVWTSREMRNKFSSSVYHDGHLYGFDEKTLKCLDARTGQVAWRERDLGHGSLVYADGHFLALGDEGTLVLFEASPAAYREKARVQVFEGRTWTVPTLSGGRLFLRDQNQIVALDVSG